VGRGDPNLSGRFSSGRPTAAFEALADALRAAGVSRIEGRLVGHEGAFTGERRGSAGAGRTRPALEDPARYATTVFGEVLQSRGIRVMGPVATTSEPLPVGLTR
jgi:hypothetical protein